MDEEVKRFLRRQKHLSFLSSRVAGSRTDRVTDPDSPAWVALREELFSPNILPFEIPMLSEVDDTDHMNRPFSGREFSAALSSYNVRSAPGLDGVGYGALLGLSERCKEFLLSLYNRMLSVSRFPPSWGDTLVSFVPKAGTGKFRPISLTSTFCKTFERLIQRRLEFLAESNSWIPRSQFGFRRGRSSMD